MRVGTYACDVCGVQKKETNHWWIIGVHGSHGRQIGIAEWDDVSAAQENIFHLCGEACVQKKVSEFLSGAKQ